MNKNIQIYVIFHDIKYAKNIKDDEIYTPLFVGRNGKDNYGFLSDDIGDNISYKNSNYSELTGLYWMCKNSPYDIIGLVHYRRYFAKTQFGRIINKQDIEKYLKNHDLILPEKTERIKSSTYDEFASDKLFKSLLDDSKEYINKNCPEYSKSWDYIMKDNKSSFFNMFIASKELMNKYCDWLFPILDFIREEKWNEEYHERLPGVLSELLFNVWIHHNNLNVKEVPIKAIGFKLKLKTFIINLKILRWIYRHINNHNN